VTAIYLEAKVGILESEVGNGIWRLNINE